MDKTFLRRALQIAAALLVTVLVIGLYKAKTDAAHTEARVRALRIEIADAQSDVRALRAEIARAESPANVEKMAEQHLGLVLADQGAALPEAALDRRLPAPRRAPPPQAAPE
jgi:hypothetical protein